MASNDQWASFLARPGARSTDPEFNRPKIPTMAEILRGRTAGEIEALNKIETFVRDRSDKPLTPPEMLFPEIAIPSAEEAKVFGVDIRQEPSPLDPDAVVLDNGLLLTGIQKKAVEDLGLTMGVASTTATTTASAKSFTSEDMEKMVKALSESAPATSKLFNDLYLTKPTFDKAADSMKAFGSSMAGLKIRPPGKSIITSMPISKDSFVEKTLGKSADFIVFDEVQDIEEIMAKAEPTEEMKAELEKLAKEMQEYFQAKPTVVSLLAPAALTVLIPTKGYSKSSHIGGEEFVPDGVYLGKKGKLIGTFKPKDAAPYKHMEMPIDDALSQLSNLFTICEDSCADGYQSRMSDIRNSAIKQREAEELVEKADVYRDIGFGTW